MVRVPIGYCINKHTENVSNFDLWSHCLKNEGVTKNLIHLSGSWLVKSIDKGVGENKHIYLHALYQKNRPEIP